jgi:hypothetical protein
VRAESSLVGIGRIDVPGTGPYREGGGVRFLFGRPLYNCSAHLEDNSDANVDLAIRDPSEPPFPFRSLTRLRRAEAALWLFLALQNESTSREKTTTMEI